MILKEIAGYSRFLKLGKIELEEREEELEENENSFKRFEEGEATIILLVDGYIVDDLNDGDASALKKDFFNAFLYVEKDEKLVSHSLDSYFLSDAPIYLDIVDKERNKYYFTLEGEPVLADENHYFDNESDYEAMLNSVPNFLKKYNLPSDAKVNIVHVS